LVSAIRIVEHYPQSVDTVWHALTDPELISRWTSTGRGGIPVGFATAPGTRFQFVGKPMPGWDGIVNCVLLEADEPSTLRFSWQDNAGGAVTEACFRLAADPATGGTTLRYEHIGFAGPGGYVMAKLLGRVRRKMLRVGLPPVLATLA
jgi:uncharacterized protein YndB with AHSA1/START domain